MRNRRTIRRALLRLAALAGLLNLTSCLYGTKPEQPAAPSLVTYDADFQRGAARELVVMATPDSICHAPHVVTFVLDYSRLRNAIRNADPLTYPLEPEAPNAPAF